MSFRPKCVDVVGLNHDTNGRSCESHDICGNHLEPDETLIVKSCIVDIEGVEEGALSVSKISNGQVICRVGFIAKSSISRISNNTILQVIELYERK